MNIRDILRHLKIPFKEHGESPLVTAGWVGITCYWCDRGLGNTGLGIHTQKLSTTCWRCGPHNLVEALSLISEQPYGAIKALLGGLVPESPTTPKKLGKLELPPGIGPLLAPHRRYLQRRGFDPDELAEKWGIKGIGPCAGKYSWRIFLPIYGPDGTTVSWTTRAIGDVPHGDRYRGASREQSAIPRGEVLFGEHLAKHAVVVVEGPFGAIWGGPGFVCTAGVGFSRAQILRISKHSVRCILFDNEPAAQRRARSLANQLACFSGETHIIQTSGSDPDTSPLSERDEIRSLYLD